MKDQLTKLTHKIAGEHPTIGTALDMDAYRDGRSIVEFADGNETLIRIETREDGLYDEIGGERLGANADGAYLQMVAHGYFNLT